MRDMIIDTDTYSLLTTLEARLIKSTTTGKRGHGGHDSCRQRQSKSKNAEFGQCS
jgi:hypothetical protein